MSSVSSGTLGALAFAVVASGIVTSSHAAGWSDNFDNGSITDGNPVTWSTNLANAFPGNYDATSGDLRLSVAGDPNGMGGPANDQLVAWVNGMSFANTYIRAQGIIAPGPLPEETGGNLALLARLDTNFAFAYVLYIDDGGDLGLQISQGGLTDLVPNVDLPFNAGSDVIIELNVIGNELRGYAWPPGQSKPAEPQITAFDNAFTSGPAGIAYDEDDDNTTGVFRWVMAQDTPFVDTLPGDFNTDGTVDAADYVFWRDRLGNPFLPEDYNVWRANFDSVAAGAGSGAVNASVPEPMSILSTLVAIIGLVPVARARRA